MELNKISKQDFMNLKEEDVMFITNPGRMGDEDGSTFVVKNGDEYICYRVEGWMYPTKSGKDTVTYREMEEHFPKWVEAWKNAQNEEYEGKYKFIYMGFGNGLCVDRSIYDTFKPYLDEEVKKQEDKDIPEYAKIYSGWQNAVENMFNANKKTL